VVAVLPFSNLSGNADDEYFSDGITEDILTHLSKIADLHVISRTSVMQYKNTTKPIRQIAGELGAGSILEGSVRRSGNRIRIVGKLINASVDEPLWGETYDRELTDVFEIQTDVAQQIARALKATLSPAESTLIGHRPTGSLDAYAYYLRGRDLYYRFTSEENEAAIEMFNHAIAADPEYALAYAGLADAYAQRVQRFGFDPAWADTAIQTSLKAIRLDPRIAEPYKSLGLAYAQREWYHKAMDQFSMAVRINPNYSAAISNLGLIHLWTGDPVSALPLIRKAAILSPEQTINNFHLASVFDALEADSLSERYYRKTIALDGTATYAYRALAQLYVVTGRITEARAMLDTVLRVYTEDSYLLLGAGEVELFDGKPAEA
jgi:TolB-like protein/Tfp pilus assembly protein PilF